jgi:multimeric flavodoxin WrbA
MAKQVLILSASPRKGGNSDLLCDQFKRGSEEAGHQVEKIFLGDRMINYCTGCGTCSKTGKCVQEDDMAKILDMMIAADVIVMATPVYFYTMNGQMKTFIDRTCPRYAEISNKEMYFIMAAASSSKKALKRTLEGFRGFTSCLTDPKEKGVIYGTGVWKKGDIKGSKTMTQAYKIGKKV